MKKFFLLMFVVLFTGCFSTPKPKHVYEPPKDGVHKGFSNGKLVETVTYKNGVRNGEEKKYHINSDKTTNKKLPTYLYSKVNYVNGYKEGIEYIYHKNGKVASITTYVKGNLEGPRRTYYENGQLFLETNYTDRRQVGMEKIYHKNGNLKSTVPYVNGNKKGLATYYYEDGSLEYTGVWINDLDYKDKKLSARAKRELAQEEEEWQAIKKKAEKFKKSNRSKSTQLICGSSVGYSMSELSSKEAVAKGKGSGAALGYQMNHNNTRPSSRTVARNFCVQNVNSESMDCVSANAYVNACMSSFRY